MWFEGSVAQAIAASRQEGKPLLVLLTGACLADRVSTPAQNCGTVPPPHSSQAL